VTRIVTLAVALVLLVAAPAGAATTLVLPDGTQRPQPYQAWVDAAHVPTPPGVVTLRLDGCGEDMPACAPVGERSIALSPDWASPHVLLHELGHVFDDGMPEWVRARFASLVDLRGPWLATAASAPAGERFAEAYALCARHPTIRRRRAGGSYRYSPTPAQHKRACALIRAAGGPAR